MKRCICILFAIFFSRVVVSAQVEVERISTIPIGAYGVGIEYQPRPRLGGWAEPAFMYLNEEDEIVLTLSSFGDTISLFNLSSGDFIRGIKVPSAYIGKIAGMMYRDGYLYLRVPESMGDSIGKQFLTVVSEAGGVVIDKLPLFNYSGLLAIVWNNRVKWGHEWRNTRRVLQPDPRL